MRSTLHALKVIHVGSGHNETWLEHLAHSGGEASNGRCCWETSVPIELRCYKAHTVTHLLIIGNEGEGYAALRQRLQDKERVSGSLKIFNEVLAGGEATLAFRREEDKTHCLVTPRVIALSEERPRFNLKELARHLSRDRLQVEMTAFDISPPS